METFITLFLLALMVVIGTTSYKFYCWMCDLHSKWFQWNRDRKLRANMKRCTRQAYSRRHV